MVERIENAANSQFVRELRRALRHLYDPDELRRNTLARLFPQGPHQSSGSLQQILISAIEALRPGSGTSPQSSAWRTYQLLFRRYVQQFRQAEVARVLGLSLRQMGRQEVLAHRVLADYLWQHYELGGETEGSQPALSAVSDTSRPSELGTLQREDELRWAEESLAQEPVSPAELIQGLLDTVAPLARELQVRLLQSVAPDLPRLVLRAAALRQALLNLMALAVQCVPGGEVSVIAQINSGQMSIDLRPHAEQSAASSLPDDLDETIDMARQLVTLSGGTVQMAGGEGDACPFTLHLDLPALEPVPVLVIDDNHDALRLLQRYLAGTRFAFVGASDAQQALEAAQKLAPQAILLDVMLPGVDGWEILGRLREHPSSRSVPIIVCTILPQEKLALAFGAAAFLRKPISRPELLAALEGCTARPSPGCCS